MMATPELQIFPDLLNNNCYVHIIPNFEDVFLPICQNHYAGGTTNTASALNVTNLQLLSPANGARSGAAKVVIVLTDGR